MFISGTFGGGFKPIPLLCGFGVSRGFWGWVSNINEVRGEFFVSGIVSRVFGGDNSCVCLLCCFGGGAISRGVGKSSGNSLSCSVQSVIGFLRVTNRVWGDKIFVRARVGGRE